MNIARFGVLVLVAAAAHAATTSEIPNRPTLLLLSPTVHSAQPAVAVVAAVMPRANAYACSIGGLVLFGLALSAAWTVARQSRDEHRRHVAAYDARRRPLAAPQPPVSSICEVCSNDVHPPQHDAPPRTGTDAIEPHSAFPPAAEPSHACACEEERRAA